MNSDFTCSVIKDLYPLYCNGVVSEETKNIIQNHLDSCPECHKALETLCKDDDKSIINRETTRYAHIAKKIKKRRISIIVFATMLIVGILILYTSVFQLAVVAGNCMDPTIEEGEKYMINKLTYKLTNPKRHDVIVFEQKGSYYISRVVALPGEMVEIEKGAVKVDGKKINVMLPEEYPDTIFKVGEKECFILPDNPKLNDETSKVISEDSLIGKLSIQNSK